MAAQARILDPSEISGLFEAFDKDGNGSFDFAEFCSMLQQPLRSKSQTTVLLRVKLSLFSLIFKLGLLLKRFVSVLVLSDVQFFVLVSDFAEQVHVGGE